MKCHVCNNEIKDTDKFCENCGIKVEVVSEIDAINKCPRCNVGIKEGYKFCHKCGKSLLGLEEENTNINLTCHICNSPIQKHDKFCLSCGARLTKGEEGYEEDIIASRLKATTVPQNKKTNQVFYLSLGALGVALILGSFFPIFAMIISIGVLAFAIFKLIKAKTRMTGWALALAILALILSTNSFTGDLIAKDYASKSSERISDIINIDLPDIDPSFYDIGFMDGEIIKVSFREYVTNDIVYELNNDQARFYFDNFSIHYTKDNTDLLREHFYAVMLAGTDVSLVYNLDNNSFGLPTDMDDYNLIIINFSFDGNKIQILEIAKVDE